MPGLNRPLPPEAVDPASARHEQRRGLKTDTADPFPAAPVNATADSLLAVSISTFMSDGHEWVIATTESIERRLTAGK